MADTPKSNALLTLDEETLKACIHCGMCLPHCPTYRVTGSEAESPRGRLSLMKKMRDGELDNLSQLSTHIDQCLACHACETACPSGVQYGDLLHDTREQLTKKTWTFGRFLKRFIYWAVLPDKKFLRLVGRLTRWYQQLGLHNVLMRLGILKLFPTLNAMATLLPTVEKSKKLYTGMSFGNPGGERVCLFVGCVMDVFFNPVHWATIETLVANGFYVNVAEQTCCGALAHHSGEMDIAQDLARKNVHWITAQQFDWIVINSSGCGSSLKAYGDILKDDPIYGDRAKAFASKVVDIMELLGNREKQLKKFNTPLKQTVTYHAACHLHHVQGIRNETQAILSKIPELDLVPLQDAEMCCGSAGIYNIEHPELGDDILALKINTLKKAMEEAHADTVVTGNPGCLLQLQKGCREAGLDLKVKHPVELIADAYRVKL